MITIFIGYDPKEAIAYHTCVNSIIRHASQSIAFIPLALNLLPNYFEKHTDGSNEFTYTRFLVPHLMEFNGWAIYIDGDMIIKDNIVKLWNLQQQDKDVMVVKHNYQTKQFKKYLGSKNENYPRKNWSSVILWNCASDVNKQLTPKFVEQASGSELHRFSWIADEHIGELPKEWNWLPDEYGTNTDAKLLHYTLGAPCFDKNPAGPMADEWHLERILTNHATQV